MPRALLVVVVLIAAAAAALLLFWRPSGRPAAPLEVPPPVSAPAPSSIARLEPVAPPSAPTPATEAAPPGVETITADAAVEPPKGPFEVDLGRHTIHLDDPVQRRVLNVRATLVVEQFATSKEVRRRREELVRMMFFLGTHRVPEGAMGPEGRARFRDDLLERYRNVIRSSRVVDLTFSEYEVTVAPAEPAH